MQTVYRITAIMVVCIIALCILFSERNEEIFVIALIYVIAIQVYFLYELITTKKWKNLIKAVPALGIVVLLNVLIYLGMLGIYNVQLSFAPTAEEITSVTSTSAI